MPAHFFVEASGSIPESLPMAARILRSRIALLSLLREIRYSLSRFINEIRFGFLYDEQKKLFAIGFNVEAGQRDNSYYDLLASEARLSSFVAIAKGDVPQHHWFHLGRLVTSVKGRATLMSWGGTMFEYMMPQLLMRSFPGTLLDQSCRASVQRQIDYGRQRDVPWGISESAYAFTDRDGNYQYRAFGVPGLGLKRGLATDLVIAPYATALASLVTPPAAAENLERLTGLGLEGRFGFYEALDYNPRSRDIDTRPETMARPAVVRAYFAHHQGMSLVALANVVCNDVFVKRFHSDPRVQATELLLQERVPRDVAVALPRAEEVHAAPHVREIVPPVLRRFRSWSATSIARSVRWMATAGARFWSCFRTLTTACVPARFPELSKTISLSSGRSNTVILQKVAKLRDK
jgi:cyclic beta-1,2-glucan synthetase